MSGYIQLGLEGNKYAVGRSQVKNALRDCIERYGARAGRGMAFFSLETVKQIMLNYSEVSADETEFVLLEWSKQNSNLFETIARGNRAVSAEDINMAKKEIVENGWRLKYRNTRFFAAVLEIATQRYPNPLLCQTCDEPFEEWHHKNYGNCGTHGF